MLCYLMLCFFIESKSIFLTTIYDVVAICPYVSVVVAFL